MRSKSTELSDRERERRRRKRVLSYDDLKKEKGIRFSRQWILALIKQGKFPRSVKIGEASIGLIETEIDDWIESLIQERDASHAG